MARRKSADERSQERYEAEQKALAAFLPQLASLQTLDDAIKLLNQAPPQGSPARPLYANLGFFVQSFAVPAGASRAERASYLEFINRLGPSGVLTPEAKMKMERLLRASLSS